MKVILTLLMLLIFSFYPLFSSKCHADDEDGLVSAVVTVSLVTAGINGGFIALNVVNIAKPKPMGFGGKFLTGTSIFVGSATIAESVLLAVAFHDTPQAGLTILGSLVGLGTVGTGIWSFIADHKQRKNSTALSIMPFALDRDKTVPGLMLSGKF